MLLGCLLLSAAVIALPDTWSQGLAKAARDTVLSPLLWVQRQAEEGRTSRSRFQAIQAERDSVALASQSLAALHAENARLRALLELRPRSVATSVPAEVLHQTAPTEGRTLLLSVGAGSGVRIGDPVVTPEGLLGVLQSVGAQSAVAMTWAHPDFRVSAVTEDGSVLGIVVPSSNTEASQASLEFRGVAYRDTVATGTLVLTSGLGGVYPKGLPIGRVLGVRSEEMGWERIYRMTPLANPGHVGHALVIRTPVPAEVP